jgi:hypothetical protein
MGLEVASLIEEQDSLTRSGVNVALTIAHARGSISRPLGDPVIE